MAVLKNRAKMSTSTTGAGTITLGSAESGYQTFADAGVADGDVVRYVIEDGTAWEIGSGTYTATGTTLTRTVDESSNSDAALSLTGSAVVFIGAAAGDIPDLYEDNRGVGQAYTRATGSDAVAIGYATLASGDSSIAAGYTADATGPGSNAFGYSAQALGTFSTAIGRAYSSGSGSFAANIDTNSSSYGAQNTDAIAIGKNAKATLANSVAIGTNALSETAGLMALGGSTTTVKISGAYTLPTSDGTNGQVLTTDGSGAVTFADAGGGGADLYAANESSPSAQPSATGANAIAIGDRATASGNKSIALGWGQSQGLYSMSGPIGNYLSTYGAIADYSLAIGNEAKTSGSYGVALGRSVVASGIQSLSLGFAGTASATNSVAIGDSNTASHANAIVIGDSVQSTTTNEVSIGGTADTVRISESYTLPTSDGTNGQVLTTDGSGAVTFADAGGGGGADLYAAETTGSTDPTATGTLSLAIGSNAQSDGNQSVAIGVNAVSGLRGVSIGQQAGNSTASGGDYNISVGFNSAYYLTTGDNNVAVGRNALQSSNLDKLTGSSNVGVGYLAGSKVASGSFNTFLGINAGNSVTTGSNNVSIGYNSDCSAGTSSQTAVGYNAQAAGSQATALTYSYASGADSFAAAIANNTSSYGASGANSVAMGYLAKATNTYGVALGKGAQATGNRGYAIGNDSTASATKSGVFGGDGNTASGGSSVAIGGYYANARENNKVVFGGGYLGVGAGTNLNQSGILPLGAITTDATATVMRSDNLTAGTANQLILPNNSAFAFHGTIVARQQAADGTACAAWKVEGLIRREGSAGTTVLVNSATTVLDNTPSWGLALSADTTNGALKVTATGAAATDIRWVATIHTSEVTYA